MRPQTSKNISQGKSRNIQFFTFSQTEKSNDSRKILTTGKSRASLCSRISDVSTEEEKSLLRTIKHHSSKVGHMDPKIREAIELIRLAINKQDWL